jgi:hypothetical protein
MECTTDRGAWGTDHVGVRDARVGLWRPAVYGAGPAAASLVATLVASQKTQHLTTGVVHRPQQVIGPYVEAKGRSGFRRIVDHHNALGPRSSGALPCSRPAAGLWTSAVVHLSGQEHTRALCNARLSVFIRMKPQDWVADLECGQQQHVRHAPPWLNRPWVVSPEGRQSRFGSSLDCKHCNHSVHESVPPK